MIGESLGTMASSPKILHVKIGSDSGSGNSFCPAFLDVDASVRLTLCVGAALSAARMQKYCLMCLNAANWPWFYRFHLSCRVAFEVERLLVRRSEYPKKTSPAWSFWEACAAREIQAWKEAS